MIGGVFDRHRDVDVVLLAFGVLGDQAAFDADPMLAVAAARTNYVGAVAAGLVTAERLRRQGHGTLVVLSSVAGERVRQGQLRLRVDQGGPRRLRPGPRRRAGRQRRRRARRAARVRAHEDDGRPARRPAGHHAPRRWPTPSWPASPPARTIVWVPPALRYVFAVFRHLPRSLWRRLPN